MNLLGKIYGASFSKRIIFFTYFIASISIASILYSLNSAKNYYFHNKYTNDPLYKAQQRLSSIKPYIKMQKIVGYLSDSKDSFNIILAQHVLIPTVIEQSVNPEYVIGDFYKGDYRVIIDSKKLQIIHDFGNNVFLLKHILKQ